MMLAGDFRHLWRQAERHFGAKDEFDDAPLEAKIASRRAWYKRFLNEVCPTRETVIAALDRMNIAWGDVRSGPDVVNQPTVLHRDTLTEVQYPDGAVRRIPQSPYRFSAADSRVRGHASALGEHNQSVLKDWLDMDDATIARYSGALVTGS
jgi:crotonobetainyl-CoA:carnitine CoA-transferase CaiB-like acyl-CoA transferase